MEWCLEILDLTQEGKLRYYVQDNLDELGNEAKGAVTLFFTITRRLVVQNQEATDAMQAYIWNFNVRCYDGKNICIAAGRVKAIARALGPNLPSNAVAQVLRGFAKASSEDFKATCLSMLALLDNLLLAWEIKQTGNVRPKIVSNFTPADF